MVIYPSVTLQGSDKCLLLIHGYTGSPYEMIYIARGVNEKLGWTVRVPRLPGHASSSEDFSKTRWRDWLRRAKDEYMDLSVSCSEVVVGGLSMGGIISLIIGVEFKVKKLILYAPAFTTVFQKYVPLIYLLSLFVNRFPKKEEPAPFEDPIDEMLRKEYWRYNFYRQGREFFKLQRIGRKMLGRFEGESLIIVSKGDMTVPIEVLEVLKDLGGKKRVVVLEKSGHVVTKGEEKERVLEETIDFLEG